MRISLASVLRMLYHALLYAGGGPGPRPEREVHRMDTEARKFAALVKEIRRQLALSQEDLARQIGVSYATVNRWENCQSKPSKLAKAQFDAFCEKMISQGKLRLPEEGRG